MDDAALAGLMHALWGNMQHLGLAGSPLSDAAPAEHVPRQIRTLTSLCAKAPAQGALLASALVDLGRRRRTETAPRRIAAVRRWLRLSLLALVPLEVVAGGAAAAACNGADLEAPGPAREGVR